jgi:putative membrane protein
MSSAFIIIGSVFLGLAALIHLYIFYLESVVWSKPSTWKAFGLKSQAEADTIKPMAYNQGFYNVFLGVGIGLGLILLASATLSQAGLALALFAGGSMVLASLVLVTSNPKAARSAAIQGAAPLIGIIFLVLGLAVS